MLSDAPVYGKVSTRSLQSRALFVVCARPLFWRKLFRKSISSQRVCCICVLYDITLAKNLRCRQLCVRVLVEGKEKKTSLFFSEIHTIQKCVWHLGSVVALRLCFFTAFYGCTSATTKLTKVLLSQGFTDTKYPALIWLTNFFHTYKTRNLSRASTTFRLFFSGDFSHKMALISGFTLPALKGPLYLL